MSGRKFSLRIPKSDRERATAAGFDVHLTKPADPATIEALLAEGKT
jgi:CheY-like chemotaxis protein